MHQNAFQNHQTIPKFNFRPNPQPRFQSHQPFPPQRPIAPKPQRPQPMEPIHTRNVNYQKSRNLQVR